LKLSYKPGAYVLRHSFSNAFIEMGGTTEELQDALNHGTKNTTERYKHGFTFEKKKKMSEGLFKK
jgi:site-specific recombinase XerD